MEDLDGETGLASAPVTCEVADFPNFPSSSPTTPIISPNIEPTPSLGSDIKTDIILGMGKIKGKVKILLDINRVLTFDELAIPA